MGYYLVAIGEDEDAAEAIGVNAPQVKRDIYMISAFLTALAGTFYTQYIYFIDPATAFNFNISIEAALVSIVGGIGTLVGAGHRHGAAGDDLGAAAELARPRSAACSSRSTALILMAVILWRPTGIMGWINEAMQRHRDRQAGQPQGRAMTDALVIKGLNKRFGGLRAVQDVSFTVRENETLALIGPNGAGKTTSFQPHHGLLPPRCRLGFAFGQEIVGLRPHRVCALGLARTFQVAKPFGGMTVLANVMTGAFLRDRMSRRARDKAREAIDFVGLSARENTAASDLTTIDQRRLEMARALATQPKMLLLDEVMAGFNPAEIDQAVGAGRQAFGARAHDRHRRAPDARDHGGRQAHRRARPRPEDRRRVAEGDRREPGGDPRLSRLELRACAGRRHACLSSRGVSARYGSVPAITDVTIDVGDGEAVGLLGANGAGKSTTLRAISGLVKLTAGSITFVGRISRRCRRTGFPSSASPMCRKAARSFPR